MLEIWELITGRKQHKIGKDGEDFLRKPRPDKSCSAADDDDDESRLLEQDFSTLLEKNQSANRELNIKLLLSKIY
jgi:hypothetical protein